MKVYDFTKARDGDCDFDNSKEVELVVDNMGDVQINHGDLGDGQFILDSLDSSFTIDFYIFTSEMCGTLF